MNIEIIHKNAYRTITLFLSAAAILLLLSSCAGTYRETGLENYSKYTSSLETSLYLFPCDDYIDKYPYEDGNYYWVAVDSALAITESDKSFAYFVYTPEIYSEAYEYITSELKLNDNVKEYNGYTFIEHNPEEPEESSLLKFPFRFWMMFYSESRSIIGFIGCHFSGNHPGEKADGDFGKFLKTEFEMFDWEEERQGTDLCLAE